MFAFIYERNQHATLMCQFRPSHARIVSVFQVIMLTCVYLFYAMPISIKLNNDNEVYFKLATSNSRIDKHRTVVEKHIKTTKYNAKKKITM